MKISNVLRLLAACVILLSLPATAQFTRMSAVTSVAGSGTAGYDAADEGTSAKTAKLNGPQGLAMDSFGNIYVADTANNRIRKVDGKTGALTTVAGNGTAGYRAADENVIATNGELSTPQDVALDEAGNLYIADTGNHRVRKVVLSTGLMTTVAGAGGSTYNQQELGAPTAMNIAQPTAVLTDASGNLFIVDAVLNRVFYVGVTTTAYGARPGQIKTIAGTSGSGAYTTTAAEENVLATLAHFNAPRALALDSAGVVYVADAGNNRVRKLTVNSGGNFVVTTVVGDGTAYSGGTEGASPTAAGIGAVSGLRFDPTGDLYLVLTSSNRVLRLSGTTGKMATFAGDGTAAYLDGKVPAETEFNGPTGILIAPAGTIFLADTANQRIRTIPPARGNVIFPRVSVGTADTSVSAILSANTDITITAIHVLTPAGKPVEYVAGAPLGCSIGTAMVKGTVCSIPVTFTPVQPGRRTVPLEIVTNVGTQRFGLSGMGSGPLVVYSPQTASTFAGALSYGSGYVASEDNGPATAAHFATLDYTSVDGADNLLIGDQRNNRIRKVANGIVTTVAGNGLQVYAATDEGKQATAVPLCSPTQVIADAAGNLYINDGCNLRIRKVDAVTGAITTIAGNGSATGAPAIGLATSSTVVGVNAMALDQQGNLYLAYGKTTGLRLDAVTGMFSSFPMCTGTFCAATRMVVDDSGIIFTLNTDTRNTLLTRTNLSSGALSTVLPISPATSVTTMVQAPDGNLILGGGSSGLMYVDVKAGTATALATYGDNVGTGYVLDSQLNAIYQHGTTYQLGKTNSQTTTLAYTGSTVVGQTSSDSPKVLRLGNFGDQAFVLAVPQTGANPSVTSDFQLGNSSTCPQFFSTSTPTSATSLLTGKSCTYSVNFVPTAPGSVQGSAVFTDNQFGSPTPVTQTSVLTGTASGTVVTTSLGMTGLAKATAGTAQTVTITAYSGQDQTHVATNYTGTVTFASNDTNTGVLPAAYTFTVADAGVHTFAVTLKAASDSAFVSVTDRSNSALTAQQRVSITAAAAVNLAATGGTPQSADTNAQFSASLRAKVTDTYGNPVSGVVVTYIFPTSGASAVASSPSATTDDLGEVRVIATANGTTGSYTVTAHATGITAQISFQLTNNVPVSSFSVTSNAASFGYGPDLRLTANITPRTINGHDATGSVTFYEGSTVLSTQTVNLPNGSPSFLVPAPSVGTHTYTASYTGDTVYPATARGVSTVSLVVSKGEANIEIPFTITVVRPGSFAVSVGNGAGADSSTKSFVPPSGSVAYTINAACGSGGALSGTIPLTNGGGTFNVPADCAARGYSIAYTYAGDSNYNGDTHTRTTALTVTAPTASIAITNLDQVWDGSPKSVTVTTTPAGLAYSIGYAGSPSGPPTLAGSFPVHVAITDPNYTASADATLLVRRGPVAISWLVPGAILYGTPLSTTQLNASASVQGTFTYSPVAGTILTPGNHTLSVTFVPADSPNTPTTATVPLTVDKANLQVKAVDAGRNYGEDNPAFSATVTGAVNGDTFTTGGSTTATIASPIGTYPITPTIAGTNLAFYTVTSSNGTLTISGTPATVALSNLNQTYDGSAKPVVVTTVPVGLATSVTYNGAPSAPTAVGSYAVVATITDPNYTGTANGVLTITAGASIVTWNTPASIPYGTALSAVQLNATANVGGAFVYTPAAGAVLQPGAQTLSVTFTPSGSNTTPTTKTVILVVDKGSLTVTAQSVSRAFGAANPTLVATVTGAVNGDVFSGLASTTATATSPIGSYPITPVLTGLNQGAYNVTLVPGTLTVIRATPALSLISDKPTTFAGDTVTFTATIANTAAAPTGTVEFFNSTASLGVKSVAGGSASLSISTLAAGTYNISAVYSGDANYSAGTSPVVVQTIFTSDYTITVNPTVLTIHRGQSGTATFTVTPIGNFHDTVAFTCGTLPANATCVFAPASVTPNGGPASTTLTINTAPVTRASGGTSPAPWKSKPGALLATAFCLILGWRRRRSVPVLLLILLSAALVGGMTGCGSLANTTPVGNYSVSVSAGVSTSGGGAHAVNLTVNVID